MLLSGSHYFFRGEGREGALLSEFYGTTKVRLLEMCTAGHTL